MATKYEMVEGTKPAEDVQHQARTIQRTNDDASIYMMTEIEDGVFVAWGDCASCHGRVATCTCKTGPVMPAYIARWRDGRFAASIRHRKPSEMGIVPKPDTQPESEAPEAKPEKVSLDTALEAVKARAQESGDVGF